VVFNEFVCPLTLSNTVGCNLESDFVGNELFGLVFMKNATVLTPIINRTDCIASVRVFGRRNGRKVDTRDNEGSIANILNCKSREVMQ